MWVKKYKVKSFTSNVEYVVSVNEKGQWACSCPHWKFRRAQCKHINYVRNQGVDSEVKLIEIMNGNF